MHASPKWLITNGATSSPPPMRLYATDGDVVPNSQAIDMWRALQTQFPALDVDRYIMHYEYTDQQHRHAYTYWHSINNADNSDGDCVSHQVISFLQAHP
jgi:hypothetical protein